MTAKEERTKQPLATQTATASTVVSLPPVRQMRSNPINTTPEKATKTIRQQQSQQTLLNIQKDVEWLAKQQSLQRSKAAQPQQHLNNEG